jgi:hypothetical protein
VGITGDDLEIGAEAAAVFDAPALTFNLSRQASVDGLSCALDKDNMVSVVSTEVSFGMGLEAGIYAPLLPGGGNGTLVIGGRNIALPSTSIPIVSTTVTAASTCVGEVKGGKTEGPVVITSVTPSPTATRSGSAETPASPGAKAPGSDASTLVANLCAVVLIMIAMLFMSL